jgi:glutamyl-tRNA synthetase
VRDGAKTILELADATIFVLKPRPLELPEKAQALLNEETCGRLSRLRDRLASAAVWEVPALEAEIRGFAESEGVGIGKFGQALRAVLSCGFPAPDLAGALVALGRDESLGRLDDALSPAP